MGNKHSGFASMGKEEQRRVASKGGKSAHQMGRAHTFSPEEARAAALKAAANRKAKKAAQSSAQEGIGGA